MTRPGRLHGIMLGEMHQKRELLQLHGQIDGDQADVRRQLEHDGREIEDALDAGGNEGIGDLLGGVGGNGEDGERCPAARDHLGNLVGGLHRQAFNFLADFVRVGVEQADKLEALLGEAMIAQKRRGPDCRRRERWRTRRDPRRGGGAERR